MSVARCILPEARARGGIMLRHASAEQRSDVADVDFVPGAGDADRHFARKFRRVAVHVEHCGRVELDIEVLHGAEYEIFACFLL